MAHVRQLTRIKRGPRRPTTPKVRAPRGGYDAAWAGDAIEPKTYIRPPVYGALSEAPPELAVRASHDKLPWVRRFVEENCPRGCLRRYALAHATAHRIPVAEVPPYSTLNTWAHQYRAYGLLGLVDSPRCDAGTSRALNAVAPLIKSKIDLSPEELVELALFGGKLNYAGVSIEINRLLPSDGKVVSYDTIRRAAHRVKQRNPELAAIAEHGETHWNAYHRLALSHGYLPAAFRISIDSTVADQWVRIPDVHSEWGWTPVRPVLTVLQDVGSKMFLTFGFSFSAIDSGICLSLLGRALTPSRNYPGLLSIVPPRQITLDKGAEHQAQFRTALKTLGIQVVPRRENSPEAGAQIERLIETVQLEVFRNEVGYSKTHRAFDPYAPPEADSKRSLTALKYENYKLEVPVMALPTIEDVEASLLGWAITYNLRPHSGLPHRSPQIERLVGARHIGATSTESAVVNSVDRVGGRSVA